MYKNNKVLAIIPARGGSKRLPQKNVLDLNGKPIISWTIEASLKSKYIDKTIVSTDSEFIMEISEKYGASVPFKRPANLSSDEAKSLDVIFHAVDFLKDINEEYKYVILLQPTSPFRTSVDIDNSIKMLNNKVKAVLSVCETEHSPLWANILPNDLSMTNFLRKEIIGKRSQELPNYYRLNGAIYLIETEYLNKMGGFIGEHTYAYVMNQDNSLDIDTKQDYLFAKFLASIG